jgi:hypothetical protein
MSDLIAGRRLLEPEADAAGGGEVVAHDIAVGDAA